MVAVDEVFNCGTPDECCSGNAEFSNHCPGYGPLCCYGVGQTGCSAAGGDAACCQVQSGDDVGRCVDDTCCSPPDRPCERTADCCADEGPMRCEQGLCVSAAG